MRLTSYQPKHTQAEEHDKMLKRMQQRIREEDLRILRGEQDVDENGDFDEDMGGDELFQMLAAPTALETLVC